MKAILSISTGQTTAVAEHSIEWGHQIKFKDTEILAKIADYVD